MGTEGWGFVEHGLSVLLFAVIVSATIKSLTRAIRKISLGATILGRPISMAGARRFRHEGWVLFCGRGVPRQVIAVGNTLARQS